MQVRKSKLSSRDIPKSVSQVNTLEDSHQCSYRVIAGDPHYVAWRLIRYLNGPTDIISFGGRNITPRRLQVLQRSGDTRDKKVKGTRYIVDQCLIVIAITFTFILTFHLPRGYTPLSYIHSVSTFIHSVPKTIHYSRTVHNRNHAFSSYQIFHQYARNMGYHKNDPISPIIPPCQSSSPSIQAKKHHTPNQIKHLIQTPPPPPPHRPTSIHSHPHHNPLLSHPHHTTSPTSSNPPVPTPQNSYA